MAKTFTFEEAAAPATFSFEEALGPAEAGGTGLIQSARSAPMLYGEDPTTGPMQPQSSMSSGAQTAVVTDPSGDGSIFKNVKLDAPTFNPATGARLSRRAVAEREPTAYDPRILAPKASAAGGFIPLETNRSAGDIAGDAVAAPLKIGPTALKTLAQVYAMGTAGAIGERTSRLMDEGMGAIEGQFGSKASKAERLELMNLLRNPDVSGADLAAFLSSKPALMYDMGITTAGSMLVPMGAVGAVGRAMKAPMQARTATAISQAVNDAMNAAGTFEETQGDLGDKYLAAGLAAIGSRVAGKLTGGGLEGQAARSMAGQKLESTGLVGKAMTVGKEMGKESTQEYIENASQSIAQDIGEGRAPDLGKANKEGVLGAVIAPVAAGPITIANVRSRASAELAPPVPAPVPDPVVTVQAATTVDGAITAAAQAVDAAFNERDRQQAKSEQAVSNIARILGTEIPDVGTAAAVPGVVEPAAGGGAPDAAAGVGAGVGTAGPAGQPMDAGGMGGQPAGGAVSLGAGQPGALNFAQPPGPVRQITVTPAGTLTAIGDPKALVRLLKSAGVTNVIPATNGITVGKSQASMARQVLDDFVAAPPENFEQDFQQELEREYQADIKAQLLAKRNPQPVKVEKKTQSPLRTMLRTVGIKPELAADITGERNKVRANNVLPFTFRKNGAQIDELVRIARERGFLTQDEDDIAAGRRLVEMIQADLRGDRQESAETIEDAMRGEQDAEILRAAARLGLDTSGMDARQVGNAVNRIERRLARARADGVRREAQAEARIEREAIQAADRRAAGPDRVLDDLADVPENASLEDAMRALGFTEQEITDAVAQESRRAQADRAGSGGAVAPAAGPAQGGDRRGEGQARQEAGGAEGRPQDLLGDAPNASQQAAARLRAEREEQDRRRQQAAPDAGGFMLSGSDRPADVGAAAGQGDLLAGADAAPAQQAEPSAPAPAEPDPLTLTPKQYHDATLRAMAESTDATLAEVREMYDTDAGRANNEQEWVRRVVEAAQAGTTLTRATLDKLLELRPTTRLPETAIPEGYQRPEARKAEAEAAEAKREDRRTLKQRADSMRRPPRTGKQGHGAYAPLSAEDEQRFKAWQGRSGARVMKIGGRIEVQADGIESRLFDADRVSEGDALRMVWRDQVAGADSMRRKPEGATITRAQESALYDFLRQQVGDDFLRYELLAKKFQRAADGTASDDDAKITAKWLEAMRVDGDERQRLAADGKAKAEADAAEGERRAAEKSAESLSDLRAGKAENERYRLFLSTMTQAERDAMESTAAFNVAFMSFINARSGEFKRQQRSQQINDQDAFTAYIRDWVSKRAQPASTFDYFKATMRAVYNGTASVEDYKTAYRRVRDAEAVKAELNKLTKEELVRTFGIMAGTSEKKDSLVNTAYKAMLRGFALGKQYGPSGYLMTRGGLENYERQQAEALDAIVENHTAEDLAAYAAEVKAEREAEAAKRASMIEGIKNPKTLEEYRRFMAYHTRDGKSTTEVRLSMLTPEQRAEFDLMLAEESRGRRKATNDDQRTQVRVAGQTVDGNIIATKHTKKGHDLYVVQLAERVSREDYETLNAGAKKIGGYYSSFRGGGAIPGFQFTTREQAQAFVTLAGGDATAAKEAAQERRDAYADDRSQTAAERLTEMADRMEADADESLNRERKANTARRARFAAAAESAAREAKATAKTMRNVAQALTNGTAKFLDRIRTKTQVQLLQTYVANAKGDELRAKYQTYAEQEKRKGQPPTQETADYAVFPEYTAYRSDLASLARQLLEVDGTKKLGERLMKVADDVSDAFTAWAKEPGNLLKLSAFSVRSGEDVRTAIFKDRETAERSIKRSGLSGKAIVFPEKRGVNRIIMSPSEAIARGIWNGDGDKRITLSDDFGRELVEGIGRVARRGSKVSVPWQFERAYERRKQLASMGIETPAEFRAALREFIGLREQAQEEDRIKAMERAMIGRRNDGLDFFPTPESVADEMIAAADIQPDMAVLEPSAGMGHIADRIRVAGAEPDVIEMSGDRRELLQEKGYHIAPVNDFLSLKPREFFTFGDVFRAPDGREGIMHGGRGWSGRASLHEINADGTEGRMIGWYDRDELVGVRHRGSDSGYDRIIMNPPFSDGRDIEHVRHAYSLLKPGGRIVALMGESAFTNQNKRATEFREWLESVGGTEEKLPEGSFLDPSLPVNTGANARMVVIEKGEGDARYAINARIPSGLSFDETRARINEMKGADIDQVREIVDGIRKAWKGGPAVQVVASYLDLPGRPIPGARGMYIGGKVYVVASSHRAGGNLRQAVAKTLAHEVIAHYGLRKILGADFDRLLTKPLQLAIASGNKPMMALREQVRRLYVDDDGNYTLDKREESDEIAARAVENAIDADGNFRPGYAWLKSVWARVAQFLRDMGISVQFTQAELQGMLVQAQQAVRDGERLAGASTVVVTQQPVLSRRSAEDAAPADGFWSKIKAGKSFTPQEIADAYARGVRGTVRSFAGFSGEKGGVAAVPGTEHAGWRDEIAGFDGYVTVGVSFADGSLAMGVIPRELYPGRGSALGLADLGEYSLATYAFTPNPDGSYRLDVFDPRRGGSVFDELARRGRLEETGDTDVAGQPYYRAVFDNRYTTSHSLIQEAVRRLGYHLGAVPTVVQIGRDTGSRANPGKEQVRTFTPEFIERRLARAFHGTPHEVDRFSTTKIGTGEGAQAYGWGLYFASKREIAEYYRNALVQRDPQRLKIDGKSVDPDSILGRAIEDMARIGKDAVLQKLDDNIRFNERYAPDIAESYRDVRSQVQSLSADRVAVKSGRLYEVEIPEDSEMLLWDKPLSEQSAMTVSKVLKQGWQHALYRKDGSKNVGDFTGADLYRALSVQMGGDHAASEALASIGIKGIKYLDGVSRGDGDGTYNYVIFDDADVEITARYALGEDQTNTPAFRKWFGNSKVVDAEGKPLVVYHGTQSEFTAFDPKRASSGLFGRGFYFTDYRPMAEDYADGGPVMEVYLSLQNPAPQDVANQVVDEVGEDDLEGIRAELERLGYDGVMMRDAGELLAVAFRPEQIKSATGNRGTFDAENPDIRYALAADDDFDANPVPRPRSRWLDDAGRLRFLPGTVVYDLLGKAATPLLNRAYLKTQSKPLRRAIREMKLTVQKAQDTAEEIGREVVKLTDAEREMVSDIIEKELASGVVPPEHAVKLAATMNEVLGKQSDELVELGMLASDTAEQWRGKYLARYYKDKLGARVQSAWDKAISTFGAKPMRGLRGNHFKGRGLFEVIPEAELPTWEANGWEVRDPDYQEGITKDGTVRVWRDFTRAEREKMGEIRDAGFRFVMGYMETQKDIALGRMFQAIAADPELSSKYQTEELSEQVPDGTISGTGVKKYGKLAGRWVSKETISHLSQIEESQSEAFKMYRKAMGLWKETKTSLNPVAHANNIVSNITMAHFAGVSYWDGHKYAKAMRDFATKSDSVQEAKDAGLFLGTVSDAELMNVLPEDLKAIVRQQDGALTKVGSTAFNAMTWFLRKPMGAAYQAEDTFFRYLIWKDARDRGMSTEDAVDYSLRYIFAYDDLPRTARYIRDFGIPFFAYTYKAIPALLHTALNYPWRFAAPAAVMWGINAAAYAIAVGDEDDDWIERLQKYLTDPAYREKARAQEKMEREYLPEWMKGNAIMGTPKAIRLGMDEVTKLPLFIDVYRMVPGGDMLDMNNNAGGTPWLQPLTPNHPLLTTYMAMFGNRDGWTGKDVVDKNDTSEEATQKRLGWMWRQVAPALAYGNYHFERSMQALANATGKPVKWAPDAMGGMEATGIGKDGLPVQPKYAGMQTFGLKVRPIDVEMGQVYDNAARAKTIREIDAEVRRLQRFNAKGAVSDATLDREREKADLKKDRLREGLTVDGNPR